MSHSDVLDVRGHGDVLDVRGGVGGTAVNLAELADLARALAEAARLLDGAGAALRGTARRLTDDPAAVLVPFTAARAAAALAGAARSATSLAADSRGLSDVARAARAVYEDAETSVTSVLDRVRRADLPGPGALLARHPFVLPPEILPPHLTLRPTGWALAAIPGATPAVTVTPVGDPVLAARLTGAGDLLARLEELYPAAGGEDGSVEVRRIDHPDGGTSWAVLIPGTQSLAPRGSNPMDNATNLQEFVGAPSAAGAAVVAALGMAGARRDQPVLLAGHSQGGIVATRLAADPRVRRHYRITTVLTAGSPVGHVPLPTGVRALHLEHRLDLVPVLDDADNPETPDRVTVIRDARAARAEVPHAAGLYAETGALADASDHPSLRAWRASARTVLGDEGATATRAVYRAERMG